MDLLTFSLFPLGWAHYLAGGLLIGAGTALLFVFTGRIGGMSSVFSTTWSYVVKRPFFQQARFTDTRGWRLVYAAGLIVGALVGNESLQTVGTTVLLTGVAYATGKAIASRQEHKP
jgi:uncharacterized membrane protein YedE/YeeE